MRPVPHKHRCVCKREWDCQNPHCTDITEQWCKQLGCDRPAVLARLGDLETAGHMVHQVGHYLATHGEPGLAADAELFRHQLLARIQEIAREEFDK